jgi:hypothetical protein
MLLINPVSIQITELANDTSLWTQHWTANAQLNQRQKAERGMSGAF